MGFVIISYNSPSQTSSQFDDFYQILKNSVVMYRSLNQPLESF